MKPFVKNILFCVIAILGDLFTSFMAYKLQLPCFLDTEFAVAITLYMGLIPGLIVAACFNPLMIVLLCRYTGTPFSFYDCLYAICGMLIVFVTWLFSRNKREFLYSRIMTVLYLLIIVVVSSVFSFTSASLLDTFVLLLFQPSTGFSAFDNFSEVMRQLKMGTFFSYLVPRIPLTVNDRLICTFAGFGIYRLLVKLDDFQFAKFRQTNITAEE